MYNMSGMLFDASVTWFGQKHGSGVHFGFGENRDSGRNRRLSRFLATSGHLLPGCYEIGRVVHVEHVWDTLRGFCDLVWAKTRFWGPFWTW